MSSYIVILDIDQPRHAVDALAGHLLHLGSTQIMDRVWVVPSRGNSPIARELAAISAAVVADGSRFLVAELGSDRAGCELNGD